MRKIYSFITIIFIYFMICHVTVFAGDLLTADEVRVYLDEISSAQMSLHANPTYGSTGGEWTVMGLARYGSITKKYKDIYISNLKNKLDDCQGKLSSRKYTEYARTVIALASIDENPENFHGYNLVEPLLDYNKVATQGINGILYTLIALDTGEYSSVSDDYKEEIINKLLEFQLEDGGWAFSSQISDADVTAVVIQALASHRDMKGVDNAIDKGVQALANLQKENGSFETLGYETCESVAQVVIALCSVEVSLDDARFVKNGNTLLDILLKYYKDGMFIHVEGGNINEMATDQAMYGLVAYYRMITGKINLYDMSDKLEVSESETEIVTGAVKEESTTTKKERNKKHNNKNSNGNKETTPDDGTEDADTPSETITKNQESTETEKSNKESVTNTTIIQEEKVSADTESTIENLSVEQQTEENIEKESNNNVMFIVIGLTLVIVAIGVYMCVKKKGIKGTHEK